MSDPAGPIGLPALIGRMPRVLILGSFPSLQRRELSVISAEAQPFDFGISEQGPVLALVHPIRAQGAAARLARRPPLSPL